MSWGNFTCVQHYLSLGIYVLFFICDLDSASMYIGVLVVVIRDEICVQRDEICCTRIDTCVTIVWFYYNRVKWAWFMSLFCNF